MGKLKIKVPVLVIGPDIYKAVQAIGKALKPDSPGGRKITQSEASAIVANLMTIARDLVEASAKAST